MGSERAPLEIRRGADVVYAASDDHVALVTRTLGIDRATWERAAHGYADRTHAGASLGERLEALRASWEECSPHRAPLADRALERCACCGGSVAPWIARRDPKIVVGRCATCGHAPLLEGAARASVYGGVAYYESIDPSTRAGYASYEKERTYREAKAARLFDRIEAAAGRRPRAMLEVGSGYGFSRSAAHARGIETAGIDVNPYAADAAKRLYGFQTHVGDLASALDSGAVARRAFDLVLHQFVLEHLEDPGAELALAARALAPGGVAAIVVPSAEAVEAEIFGASYRSLRGDHLHLFSKRSLDLLITRAGLETIAYETGCSLHLLRGFLSAEELDREVYAVGRGPDVTLVARTAR